MASSPNSNWTTFLGLVLCAGLAGGATGGPPTSVAGEIYQYVDRDGTIHLSNVPTDPRYRLVERHYPRLSPRMSRKELDKAIALYSKKHQLEPALLLAVIKTESDFNPSAVSRAGAMGLMQLMPETAASLNVHDPYNPFENINGGSRHLRYLLDRFQGDLPLALAAYNAGEHTVEQYRRIPPYAETRRYVGKVLRLYRAYLSTQARRGQR